MKIYQIYINFYLSVLSLASAAFSLQHEEAHAVLDLAREICARFK